MSHSARGDSFEYSIGRGFNKKGFVFKRNRRLQSIKRHHDSSLDVVGEKVAAVLCKLEKGLDGKIIFVQDSAGRRGDPTDLRVGRLNISAKRNSSEIKAPRISDSRDFARNWFGLQADRFSLNKFKELFAPVRAMRLQNPNILWMDFDYEDYLEKGIEFTIERLKSIDNLPKHWFHFVMGSRHDYYLVTYTDCEEKLTIVGINFNGTLSCKKIVEDELKVRDISLTSWNSFEVSFTNDWRFKLRLHTASSRIEPSLKYSITIKSMPAVFEKRKTLS